MAKETVKERLQRILDNWDSIPIRVLQDGEWQHLYLSEIKSQAAIARFVIMWLEHYVGDE